MAKYDWKQLEKEYILSDYKSKNAFLKSKGIKSTGNTNKKTKGWDKIKAIKEREKSNKIIEKTIELESSKEAQQIVDLKSIANDLALNIIKANEQLHIQVDMFGGQHNSIIDAGRLKKLTSALKDLNDILNYNEKDDKEDKIDQYLSKLEGAMKYD